MPPQGIFRKLVLSRLTYLSRNTDSIAFSGSPSLEERAKSFQIKPAMEVPCGFARAGIEPGDRGSGFDILDQADRYYLRECTGIAVVSAIFGNYDRLQPPSNLSSTSIRHVCFIMFVDNQTFYALQNGKVQTGAWKIVRVHVDAYQDNRYKSKIPKMLLHRLLPNLRFSIWIDGKLKLLADSIQILERFLWRKRDTMAIPNHFASSSVFDEAKAVIQYKRYDNQAKIDQQMNFYRTYERLAPYNRSRKMPLISDVPESSLILREHTLLINLFSCLWFNELDRFTPRDQLSFAVVRDRLIAQVPWRINMFRSCEKPKLARLSKHNH